MRHIERQNYRNENIEAIDNDAGVFFGCMSSAGGLPNDVLGPVMDLLGHPTSYVRIEVETTAEGKKLDAYLQERVGMTSGLDYKLHGNGLRGGIRYFDFFSPDAITRLETFAAKNGFKPPEKVDPYATPEGASPAVAKLHELARKAAAASEARFVERERQRRETKERTGGYFLDPSFKSPPRPR